LPPFGTEAKAALRRQIRRAVAALGTDERLRQSEDLCRRLQGHLQPELDLAAYRALPREIDVDPLLTWYWSQGRQIWLPRVAGPGDLRWHRVARAQDCVEGAYGIHEPDPEHCPEGLPSAVQVLVPGVAFTRDGHRLGQGGGFYDRSLPRLRASGCTLIGVAFREQIVDEIPVDAHDQMVGQVVTADF
jgi:5-formyltetrahydrofolate cyclo-ligase